MGGRPSWLEVDLPALLRNLDRVRSQSKSRVLGLVKADGYGHGAVEVARALEDAGIDWLGVAFVAEAEALRQAGIGAPILVLGPVSAAEREAVVRLQLTPTLSSIDQLELWCAYEPEKGAAPLPVHLKVDTGMHRLGVAPADFDQALRRLRTAPHLRLAGLLSHLSDSEHLDEPTSDEQQALFGTLLERLEPGERAGCLRHLANSAAALHRPGSRLDLVRVGGALYGVDLAQTVDPAVADPLDPVMAVHSCIVNLVEVGRGETVGYGGRWRASRRSRIAVVPVGYADGYSSRLSETGHGLLDGQRVPLVGAVSMDFLTLDVTEREARLGDRVVLLGRQGSEHVSVDELARKAGVGPYEILCRFGRRLPRSYRPVAAGGAAAGRL